VAHTTDGESIAIAVPFIKATAAEDGTVYVEGLCTDDNLDLDEQIIDSDFARKGLSAWFQDWGNVRQMHSGNLPPAGKAVSMEKRDDGIWVRAHIVEPTAVKLVKEEVYKAFSVGISKPRIIRDVLAKGGRVVDGIFSEISLVDFPANPRARFQLAKRAKSGDIEVVEKAIEPELKKIPTPAEVFGKSTDKENVAETDEEATELTATEAGLVKAGSKSDDDDDDREDDDDDEGSKGDDGDGDDEDDDDDDDDSKKSVTADLAKGMMTPEQITSLASQIASQVNKPAAEVPELTKGSDLYKGITAIVEEATKPLTDELKTLRESNETLEKRVKELEAAPDPGNRAYRGSALGALRSQAQETTAGRGDEAEAQKLAAVILKARHPNTDISRPATEQLMKLVGPEQAAELIG
jgi:hypothetical protein